MIKSSLVINADAIILFARQPIAGKTKTRLTPPLTGVQAASLYACLLEDTLQVCRRVAEATRLAAYSPASARAYFVRLAPDFQGFPQQGRSLGERMRNAFETCFRRGFQPIVLIGSDLPHLSAEVFQEAFDALRLGAEVVLGPCQDGGYYLIGLQRFQPALFDIPMSTPQVLEQTLERAELLGLDCHLLAKNFDIDTFADFQQLQALLAVQPDLSLPRTRAWMAAFQSIATISG